ncbi:MAG: class I SAM-dependent methyltransferase [Pseudohongiellaceae bacterium]
MTTTSIGKTRKVRGVEIYKKTDKGIKKLLADSHYPEIHGNKVWFSSYFIMDYLEVNPLPAKSRVMEIGCGWGILSVYLARICKARVTAIDADKKVFPFLDMHAKLNRVKISTRQCRYEKIPPRMLEGLDMIAGGDICFWDELVNPLFKLVRRAVTAEVGTIIIADPGRPPFLKLAKRCQKKFNAELIPYTIVDPTEKEGYVLVIYN